MARLRDILRGWGPADPQNILKGSGFSQGALNRNGIACRIHYAQTGCSSQVAITHIPDGKRSDATTQACLITEGCIRNWRTLILENGKWAFHVLCGWTIMVKVRFSPILFNFSSGETNHKNHWIACDAPSYMAANSVMKYFYSRLILLSSKV